MLVVLTMNDVMATGGAVSRAWNSTRGFLANTANSFTSIVKKAPRPKTFTTLAMALAATTILSQNRQTQPAVTSINNTKKRVLINYNQDCSLDLPHANNHFLKESEYITASDEILNEGLIDIGVDE